VGEECTLSRNGLHLYVLICAGGPSSVCPRRLIYHFVLRSVYNPLIQMISRIEYQHVNNNFGKGVTLFLYSGKERPSRAGRWSREHTDEKVVATHMQNEQLLACTSKVLLFF
jgi:hypothetical protein